MVAADRVVEQLRALSGAQPPQPHPRRSSPRHTQLAPRRALTCPAFPRREPAPPATRRLPAASVPVVLLSLGALCLLVAAAVFVAVAWSALGLTGRTLVLLGVTALLSLVAVVLTRRNLRGAAETFWVIVAGMLTVDLLGAQSAGLAGLDALDWRGTGALVGHRALRPGPRRRGVGPRPARRPAVRRRGGHRCRSPGRQRDERLARREPCRRRARSPSRSWRGCSSPCGRCSPWRRTAWAR